MAWVFHSSTKKQKKVGLCELEANLVCIAGSRPSRATELVSVLKG